MTTTPLRTVRLYGKLGAKFGRVFRLAVSSPAEAVHALGSQIPGFDAYLIGSKDRGVGYAVFAGKKNLAEEELAHPVGQEEIRIAPMLLGAGGDSGIFNVVLGAVLVAAGVMAMSTPLVFLSEPLITAGVAMAVGGVMQMLAPSPKGTPQDRPENRPSYSFAGPVNTQAQGNPVPVLYGRMIVGSAVISAGIEARDQAYIPTGNSGGGGGGGGGSPPWHLDWVQQTQ